MELTMDEMQQRRRRDYRRRPDTTVRRHGWKPSSTGQVRHGIASTTTKLRALRLCSEEHSSYGSWSYYGSFYTAGDRRHGCRTSGKKRSSVAGSAGRMLVPVGQDSRRRAT